MASFQVDIVPSSPFFQNNLNNLDIADLWVHQPQWQTASTSAASTDAQCSSSNNNNHNNTDDGYGYDGEKSKDKWARAREIVFPANTSSPKAPDNPNAGGVSSLVQKWKGFEAGAKRCSGAPPPPPLPPGPLPIEDDSIIGDWESDRTILSGRSSVRGRDSDATESERLRVADIIRKLTPNEAGSISPPRIRTSLDQCMPPLTSSRVRNSLDQCMPPIASARVRTSLDQSDLRCIASTPRIRGRQAYIDLLAQMERERRNELQGLLHRNAVSKFSHRGRIQAVLKIKLLRRGMEAKDGGPANRNPFESSYKPMHFRQRVNEKVQNGAVHLENSREETKNNIPNSNSVVRKLEKQQQETKTSCLIRAEEGCRASKDDDLQHDANLLHRYEEATTFIRHGLAEISSEDEKAKHKEDEEATSTNYDLIHDSSAHAHAHAHPTQMTSCNHGGKQALESASYWVAEFSHAEDGWEELQSDYQTKETEADANWIYEVSRPRSDWEYLRQERYQEMLDPFSENEEIRALLGRKSVSSFLCSGMREKIDQLMISRSQGQAHSLNNNSYNNNNNEREEKRRQVLVEGDEEGEAEDGDHYGEYFEEAEISKGQGQLTTEYVDVDPTTSQNENGNGNANGNQVHESSDQCSYHAASPSTQQSSTNYCSLDMTGRTSHGTHPTFEMEIIYDLRRHMEQLHQEISELRKSIKCCTDMQVKIHRSIKKEVSAALTHPDAKNGRRHTVKKGTGGRRCCLCCKVQVDCFLYRCGHMCTCFDCANQLHWSTGRCPVCRAQILDVVRTHPNS